MNKTLEEIAEVKLKEQEKLNERFAQVGQRLAGYIYTPWNNPPKDMDKTHFAPVKPLLYKK